MDPDDSLMADHDAEENLWDSPVKPRNDSGETPRAATKHADAAKPTYQEQQEREESLRRELESVRQVNEAIEGVIQSLNKARDNMKVCQKNLVHYRQTDAGADCQWHCGRRVYPTQYLDSNSITNRTQPATDFGPVVARRQSGHCRYRRGSHGKATRC